jgi:prolyl-tRNA editing enzyme YbaK/EbsC (Cys-tRNA(Pro) deacylase)
VGVVADVGPGALASGFAVGLPTGRAPWTSARGNSEETRPMTIDTVRAFLAAHAPDIEILELPQSTATVELAASGHGVTPAQIAKTLSLRVKERTVLVVTGGTARLNNRKVKDVLGGKASMLSMDEVAALTGHPVGGVCPFGLAMPLPIYCDVSLRAFDEVLPAAGSTNSALRISPVRLADLVQAEWVDVCDVPRNT